MQRRTEIIATEEGEVLIEDLIPDEEVVVTLSHEGYVKTQPADDCIRRNIAVAAVNQQQR